MPPAVRLEASREEVVHALIDARGCWELPRGGAELLDDLLGRTFYRPWMDEREPRDEHEAEQLERERSRIVAEARELRGIARRSSSRGAWTSKLRGVKL